MENAERRGKAAQSHPKASVKPVGSQEIGRCSLVCLYCSSTVPLLVLYWCSIDALLMLGFFRRAFGSFAQFPPRTCLGLTALVWPSFK